MGAGSFILMSVNFLLGALMGFYGFANPENAGIGLAMSLFFLMNGMVISKARSALKGAAK